MTGFLQSIQQVDLSSIDETTFQRCYVGCIVLTQQDEFLLQRLVDARQFFPTGCITTFGGKIEPGEKPIQALIRELNEELGAKVNKETVIELGAISEEATNHTELIYAYFWHDKDGTITGCYEDEAITFSSIDSVLSNPNVTDDVRWMLHEYQKR